MILFTKIFEKLITDNDEQLVVKSAIIVDSNLLFNTDVPSPHKNASDQLFHDALHWVYEIRDLHSNTEKDALNDIPETWYATTTNSVKIAFFFYVASVNTDFARKNALNESKFFKL